MKCVFVFVFIGQHEKHSLLSRHKDKIYRTKEIAQSKHSKPFKVCIQGVSSN